MRRSGAGFLLGYHGCDATVAEQLLEGVPFEISRNPYDWLGWGAYFWENDPERGLDWARLMQARGAPITTPAVVGAIIDPGLCLDLTTQASLQVIRTAYDVAKQLTEGRGETLIENTDTFRRERDCAVLNVLYESLPEPKFQTARGIFTEGGPLYEGAHMMSRTHVQIAVRDLSCIKGVFRVAL
ncbi:hypothetical protein [Caulobacter sp. RL271]|uniref:Uncharacterized protein n=1 Tax=Caulobacter segnis TaxID=88688 RepID=A0ABY4ZT87_9CAUL|nr:hypothetical protein [Caulobacter segnis]USQ95900.1 hypothetical protein MZV50_25750 [Caulobacter segnis]